MSDPYGHRTSALIIFGYWFIAPIVFSLGVLIWLVVR